MKIDVAVDKSMRAGIWIIACMFLAFIVGFIVASHRAISAVEDIRAIDSEIRDANWIMTCADVSETDLPETYKACNQNA